MMAAGNFDEAARLYCAAHKPKLAIQMCVHAIRLLWCTKLFTHPI